MRTYKKIGFGRLRYADLKDSLTPWRRLVLCRLSAPVLNFCLPS